MSISHLLKYFDGAGRRVGRPGSYQLLTCGVSFSSQAANDVSNQIYRLRLNPIPTSHSSSIVCLLTRERGLERVTCNQPRPCNHTAAVSAPFAIWSDAVTPSTLHSLLNSTGQTSARSDHEHRTLAHRQTTIEQEQEVGTCYQVR